MGLSGPEIKNTQRQFFVNCHLSATDVAATLARHELDEQGVVGSRSRLAIRTRATGLVNDHERWEEKRTRR